MRRRFVWSDQEKRLVEVTPTQRQYDTPLMTADIQEFVSPVDGTVITGRRALRDHMKRHNLVHTEDMKDSWAKAASERESRIMGTLGRRARIEALSDAFEHVRNQQRARGRP